MEIIALILSVLVGVLLVVVLKPKEKFVALLLTFSGAYLLSITVLNLFPDIFAKGDDSIGIYIILGLLIQLVLDFFSKGADHGHIHVADTKIVPWALFISLTIHAFMEGLPLSSQHHHDLLWAIVVHKVPIVMVLVSFLLHYTNKKGISLLFLIIFALMTPLGSLVGNSIPFLIKYSNEINAIVAGSFLHIATIILFESSKDHRFNLQKFSAILVGVGLAILV